MGASE